MTALPYDGALAASDFPTDTLDEEHTMNSDFSNTDSFDHDTTNFEDSFPGFGSVPYSAPAQTQARAIEVQEARPKKSYSLVLLISGLGAIAIALWVLFGTPAVTPMMASIAGLTVAVLVGLYLLTRK